MAVPVPEDERGLVLAGLSEERAIAAVVEPTTPSAPDVVPPTLPGVTAASMVDLKGLARPEKFDGTDERWLEWKFTFKTVMTLLDITPYLDRIERINVAIDMGRLTDRERNLSKLLH